MSIEMTRQLAEIGAPGADSFAGAVYAQAPSAAAHRAWGGAGNGCLSCQVSGLDGFQPTSANASYGNESSDFASHLAANFLGDTPGTAGQAPGTGNSSSAPGQPDTTSRPGAPRRRRRSGRAGRSRGARARSGRSSRSGRARNARRTGRTGGTQRAGRAGAPGGPVPARTGNPVADRALSLNGRAFKAGQTKRCADFVSTMLRQSGVNMRHSESVAGLAGQGRQVNRDSLRPGDVVLFGNTYRRGPYTHTGIYVGNGMFVHRPTANAPVRVDNMNGSYYSSRFTGGRRFEN